MMMQIKTGLCWTVCWAAYASKYFPFTNFFSTTKTVFILHLH